MLVVCPDISRRIGFNPHRPKTPFVITISFNCIISDVKEYRLRIPAGFESDGCTLRFKLLRAIFGCPHTPEYLIGSLIHDYCCKNRHLIDRNSASRAMRYMFIREGVAPWKANMMYIGVELYQKYYRKWE